MELYCLLDLKIILADRTDSIIGSTVTYSRSGVEKTLLSEDFKKEFEIRIISRLLNL